MKLLAWVIVLGSVISGCASDADTKPSFSLDPNVQPSPSRPVLLDPVCGEVVDPSTPWKAVHRDNVYSFHSEPCRARFSGDPDLYAFGQVPQRGTRVEGKQVYHVDPVCGRETPMTRWQADHDGRTYFFHDNDCLLEFRVRPQAYVTPEKKLEAR